MGKEFGGYFKFIDYKGEEYHNNAIKLNTARHCFKYLLLLKKYKKVYLPFYICDSILEQVKHLNLDYEFYHIGNNLRPLLEDKKIKEEEVLFIVNYFGFLNKSEIIKIKNRFKNIVLDNTQAFFQRSIKNIDTIYSCRKFFPVVEGGYLYTDKEIEQKFISSEKNYTFDKLKFLFKKYETSSNEAYKDYTLVEDGFGKEDIKNMSNLTVNFLKSFDYNAHKLKREKNFLYLHNYLKKINVLDINISNLEGPMFYPLLLDKNIKKDLIKEKIYVPTLWNEVKERVKETDLEYKLVENLVPVSIDYRWQTLDLDRVILTINKLIGG